jgi:thioredoxin 1
VSEKVLVATAQNWDQEVLKSPVPVLVDFWAEWCAPCRAFTPTLEAAAALYDGRARMAKVNVDENGALAERYGVIQIPTLLLIKNGQVVEQNVGGLPLDRLKRLIDAHAGVPV